MKIYHLLYLSLISCEIIEIPFTREINEKNKLSSQIFYNKIYTTMEIGEPKQKIKTYLNFSQNYYYITDKNLNGVYDKNISKTFSHKIPFEISYSKQDFEKGYS